MEHTLPAKSCQKASLIACPERKEALCFCGEWNNLCGLLWKNKAWKRLAVITPCISGHCSSLCTQHSCWKPRMVLRLRCLHGGYLN